MQTLALLVSSWCLASAWGASVEEVLGPEPAWDSDRRAPASADSDEDVQIEENLRSPGIYVSAEPKVAIQNFRLLGQGLAANVPIVFGVGADVSIGGTLWEASGGFAMTVYNGLPNDLSPSQITSRNGHVEAVFKPLRTKHFELGVGYQVYGRSADQSTPVPIVTSFIAHGPHATFAGKWDTGKWRFLSRITAAIPWFFSETGNLSGSYLFGFRSELGGCASYEIAQRLRIGIGVDFLVQGLFFSGTGSRGTANARELLLGLGIPFLVRYDF